MIKKIAIAITLSLLLIFAMVSCAIVNTTTTTSNSHSPYAEQTIESFQLNGVIDGQTLNEINVVPKAEAESSYLEITGEVNSGKITNEKYITYMKGDDSLVTVGSGTASAGGSVTTNSGAEGAAQWARAIAADDSFTYGAGERAHRRGCYFCGTNTGPEKKSKERSGEPHVVNGHTYEKTYCCSMFVTAAYAHGANDSVMLDTCACKTEHTNTSPSDWTAKGIFENVGHPNQNELQTGDVLIKSGKHVAIYVGNGEYAEATQSRVDPWGADSIRVKGLTSGKYKWFDTVVRYTGTGNGGTTITTGSNGVITGTGTGVKGALAWAEQIANDDTYTYYMTSPCHVCHESNPPKYCCASFVRAAYAHGANDSVMLKKCQKGEAGSVSTLIVAMKESGNFEFLGKIPKSQLQPGDVLIQTGVHVEMYYGDGKQVGAHSTKSGISVNNLSIPYDQVWRYKIGGSAGTVSGGANGQITIRQKIAISLQYTSKKKKDTAFSRVFAAGFKLTQENLEIANKIAAALAGRGYTKEGIAGVLGNMHWESGGLRAAAVESNGEGIGLCQWSFGRKKALKAYASSQGKSWQDLDIQIAFLCHELDSYTGMEQTLKTTTDIKEATKVFMDDFERPGDPHFAERLKLANGYYGNVSAKGTSGCNADLLISVDTDINKCVVQGTLNGYKIEAAGDIQVNGGEISLSAAGISLDGGGNQGYQAGQLTGMRTEYPESGNKWYFDKSINPFPRNSIGGNCTWYAYGRFCEIAMEKIPMSSYGNAVTFYDSFPSCQKGREPQVGAIICWGYGSAQGHPGHVAVVEEVKANGDIVCSNSGWSSTSKFWTSTHKKSENYSMHHNNDVFRGFIYQP